MNYKYFCNDCGFRFESELPERNENGLLNGITCPDCGSWAVYPDTAEGAAQSVRALNEEEAAQIAWEDDEC